MRRNDDNGEKRWEELCRQCGRCCFEKYEDGNGAIFHTRTPCRYLDINTRRCRIYERRFTINPECIKLTPELVATLPWLHPDCGYRKAREQAEPSAPPHRRKKQRQRRPSKEERP